MSDAQQSYFDRPEAARYLRVSLRTLDRLRAEGKLRACRPAPDRAVFRRADLDRYMESQLEPATGAAG
jgi:excisionase family DNA binding protein